MYSAIKRLCHFIAQKSISAKTVSIIALRSPLLCRSIYSTLFLAIWFWIAIRCWSFSAFWTWSSYGFGVVVVVGVVFELRVAIETEDRLHLVLGIVSASIVSIGLAGELFCTVRANQLNDTFIVELESDLARSRRSAGDIGVIAAKARRDAKAASDEVSSAKHESTKAKDAAGEAERVATTAMRKADVFEKRITADERRMDQATAQLAEAMRRATTAEEQALGIIAQMADRHLTPEQQRFIAEALVPFAGQRANIFAYHDRQEERDFGNEVIHCLERTPGGAQWILSLTQGSELSRTVFGVLVEVEPKADDASRSAAKALVAVLKHEHVVVDGPADRKNFGPVTGTSGTADPNASILITLGKHP